MATPKKYFHDHLILLLLSISAFLALAAIASVSSRLATTHASSYIVQYRSSLGINKFQPGSVVELISLAIFAPLVAVIHAVLSARAYSINRQLAVTILGLGLLLLVMTLIVSNALLVLR